MESYFEGSLSCLLLPAEVWHVQTTFREPCDMNLLMWKDLISDPSFRSNDENKL